MKHLAKVTSIKGWYERNHARWELNYEHDGEDTYVEVNSSEQANMLNELNELEERISKKEREYLNKYGC